MMRRPLLASFLLRRLCASNLELTCAHAGRMQATTSSQSTFTTVRSPHQQKYYSGASVSAAPDSATTNNESAKEMLKITDRCWAQLKRVAEPGECLRVMVDGGGCSGFEYKFSLDGQQKATDDDVVFEREGATILVDSLSMEYMKGSTLDYKEELIKAAFRVSENPLAEKGCSCGVSFALKS